MPKLNDVYAYNREIREALRTLYDALPPGQQRTVAKQAEVKRLLERYKISEGE